MGMVLGTSVELQAPHKICGVPFRLALGALKNESCSILRKETIWGVEELVDLVLRSAYTEDEEHQKRYDSRSWRLNFIRTILVSFGGVAIRVLGGFRPGLK
jgi:hypothetical protein